MRKKMEKSRKGYTDKLGRRWEWDDNNKKYVYQRKQTVSTKVSAEDVKHAQKKEKRMMQNTETVSRVLGKDSDAARQARIRQKSAEIDRQTLERAQAKQVAVPVNKQHGLKVIKEKIAWSKQQEASLRDELLTEKDANKKAGLAKQLKTYARYTQAAKRQLQQFENS